MTFSNTNNLKVLCVYGEGGHKAQMNRLILDITSENSSNKISFITLSDDTKTHDWSSKHFVTSEFRDKKTGKINFEILNRYRMFKDIFSKNDITGIISTGPGFCVFYAILAKVLGLKVIHIETWSRFDTSSFTGRIMYRLSDKFYVQNIEQLEIYKKAIYSGRL